MYWKLTLLCNVRPSGELSKLTLNDGLIVKMKYGKGLNEKFSQNLHLKKYLMDAGNLLLAEASPSDRYCGTGVGLGKTDTTKQQLWKGKNKLGQLLMQLRTEFK